MLNRAFWIAVVLGVCLAPNAEAQAPCSSGASNKPACAIFNVYGPGGLGNGGALADVDNHNGHFEASFLSNLDALNSSIGSQLGVLPLVSPSSGISLSLDKSLGILVPSDYNLGPILSERAGTVGRHKLLFGFAYQHFDFNTLDGSSLKNLPVVFTHVGFPLSAGPQAGQRCSVQSSALFTDAGPAGPQNQLACSFVRDTIVTRNNIGLHFNQFTPYLSFGLTSRLDVSVAIPIVSVRMGVTSVANIHNNGSDSFHQFNAPGTTTICEPNPCLNQTFSDSAGGTGIGDVTVRVKYALWNGERAGLAVGTDIRFPTGDALSFQGSGAYGVRPFGAFSFSPLKRLSTHLNGGYEWNGESILAGNITLGTPTKANLPGQFFYSAGAEVALSKRVSAAFDYLGQVFFSAPRIRQSTYQELPACLTPPPSPNVQAPQSTPPFTGIPPTGFNSCPASPGFAATGAIDQNFQSFTGTYSTSNAALGLRFRPFGHFLITANAVIKLNDAGLRSPVVPLVGISYTH
jgi:hypothetical protein